MFSKLLFKGFSAPSKTSYLSDDHPEGFTVDPSPLPEATETVKHTNIKNFFNRSYIEAATIGAGSIAVLAMVVKYSKK